MWEVMCRGVEVGGMMRGWKDGCDLMLFIS